jgi:hypothetical protein
MIGLLINEMEKNELEYLIKRELEELLFDLDDHRIDTLVKDSMKKRYQQLYQLLLRVGSEEDCLYYMPRKHILNES